VVILRTATQLNYRQLIFVFFKRVLTFVNVFHLLFDSLITLKKEETCFHFIN